MYEIRVETIKKDYFCIFSCLRGMNIQYTLHSLTFMALFSNEIKHVLPRNMPNEG